jgi:flagellar basal body rod protein FlgG
MRRIKYACQPEQSLKSLQITWLPLAVSRADIWWNFFRTHREDFSQPYTDAPGPGNSAFAATADVATCSNSKSAAHRLRHPNCDEYANVSRNPTIRIHNPKEGVAMLSGLYSAAAALELGARNHEVIAENLAHVATPGYRRQGLIFDSFADSLMNPSGEPQRLVTEPASFSMMEAGPLQQTHNPLDVAVVGDAFFVLQGPNGPVYTRNGAFEPTATGALQARGLGYPVLGQGGPINIPPNTSMIGVGPDGTVSANGTIVGQLQIASFARPQDLRRIGSTLFEGGAPAAPVGDSFRVEQGFREGSNVQPVHEMVNMIMGMRYYEAAEKSMRALSEAIALNTRPQQ